MQKSAVFAVSAAAVILPLAGIAGYLRMSSAPEPKHTGSIFSRPPPNREGPPSAVRKEPSPAAPPVLPPLASRPPDRASSLQMLRGGPEFAGPRRKKSAAPPKRPKTRRYGDSSRSGRPVARETRTPLSTPRDENPSAPGRLQPIGDSGFQPPSSGLTRFTPKRGPGPKASPPAKPKRRGKKRPGAANRRVKPKNSARAAGAPRLKGPGAGAGVVDPFALRGSPAGRARPAQGGGPVGDRP